MLDAPIQNITWRTVFATPKTNDIQIEVAKRRGNAANAKAKTCCLADVPVDVFWEVRAPLTVSGNI